MIDAISWSVTSVFSASYLRSNDYKFITATSTSSFNPEVSFTSEKHYYETKLDFSHDN